MLIQRKHFSTKSEWNGLFRSGGQRKFYLVILEKTFQEFSRILQKSFARFPVVIYLRANLLKMSTKKKFSALNKSS